MTLKQKIVELLKNLLSIHNVKAKGKCGALCMCRDIKVVIEYFTDEDGE
jgi:hypothetical protein